jgi:DNA-directed RNA polymerase specialized sigma24 family protein
VRRLKTGATGEHTMERRTRVERNTGRYEPSFFNSLTEDRSAWHESPREIQAGLQRGKRKAVLLRWVRREMERRLTRRQRQYMDLYYFRGMSYAAIGRATGTNPSSVCRSVRRALNRLTDAAEQLDEQDALDRTVMRLTGRDAPRGGLHR